MAHPTPIPAAALVVRPPPPPLLPSAGGGLPVLAGPIVVVVVWGGTRVSPDSLQAVRFSSKRGSSRETHRLEVCRLEPDLYAKGIEGRGARGQSKGCGRYDRQWARARHEGETWEDCLAGEVRRADISPFPPERRGYVANKRTVGNRVLDLAAGSRAKGQAARGWGVRWTAGHDGLGDGSCRVRSATSRRVSDGADARREVALC